MSSNHSALVPSEPCPHCGRYLNRACSVDALFVKDSQILLVLRGVEPYKGYWAIPGGHVDFDETFEEAALRELKEETGLIGSQTSLLGVFSNPKRHPKQTAAVAYIVKNAVGEPKGNGDAKEAKFFPLNELPTNLAFDHSEIINKYLVLSSKY
jgi:ADP-ribose pyrophosphatase YjhB (NUDIX family)